MKKILNFFNSVQTFVGLFYLLLSGICFYCAYGLMHSSDSLGLRIIGTIIIGACALLLLIPTWEHFKKAYDLTTHYSKEERDAAGDLLIGRVQGGKYL